VTVEGDKEVGVVVVVQLGVESRSQLDMLEGHRPWEKDGSHCAVCCLDQTGVVRVEIDFLSGNWNNRGCATDICDCNRSYGYGYGSGSGYVVDRVCLESRNEIWIVVVKVIVKPIENDVYCAVVHVG